MRRTARAQRRTAWPTSSLTDPDRGLGRRTETAQTKGCRSLREVRQGWCTGVTSLCRDLAELRHACSMTLIPAKLPVRRQASDPDDSVSLLGSTEIEAVPCTMSTLTPARRWCVTRAAGSAWRSLWAGRQGGLAPRQPPSPAPVSARRRVCKRGAEREGSCRAPPPWPAGAAVSVGREYARLRRRSA